MYIKQGLKLKIKEKEAVMGEENRNLFGDVIPEENEKLIKLTGSVEQVIYYNEENGYMVCVLGTDDDDLITITGILPYVNEGDSLIVYGEWKHNPKYGRQFVVNQYERHLPANASAILRYLSSGAIKGIGKKTAMKIVEEFGDNTLEVLENHPDWLSDIPGISLKKAKQICEDFKSKAGIRTAMIFFREYFGAATTVKIYKRWGSACIDIAKNNPYRLCDEIDGIGFERADSMAMKLGLEKDSYARLVSGVAHVLRYNAAQNGHVCLPREKLVQASAHLLGADAAKVNEVIDDMISMGKLRYSLFNETVYLYDKYAYECECYIAENFTAVHGDLRAGICFDRTGVAVCLGVVTDRCAIYHKGAILTNRNSAAMTGIGTYIVLQHNTATQCNMTTRSPLITRIDQRRGRRNTAVCRASFENGIGSSLPYGTAIKCYVI